MKFARIILTAIALLTLDLGPWTLDSNAATGWNPGYGMGNLTDDPVFTGAGVPYTCVSSVQSNSLYYVTSAAVSGAPLINAILLKDDLIAGTVKFYQATNSYIIASNTPVLTNIVWLTGTNAGIATNDIFVYRDVVHDQYQMTMIGGGNLSDGTGLVATNALNQNAIYLRNAPSNAITAGDMLYKMVAVATFTPLSEYTLTNAIAEAVKPVTTFSLNNMNNGLPLGLGGPVGLPTLTVLTTSNSAGGSLFISGQYFKRPRL